MGVYKGLKNYNIEYNAELYYKKYLFIEQLWSDAVYIDLCNFWFSRLVIANYNDLVKVWK